MSFKTTLVWATTVTAASLALSGLAFAEDTASIESVFATRALPPTSNNIVIGDDGVAMDAAMVAAPARTTQPLDRPDLKMGGGATVTGEPPAGVKQYSREEIQVAVQTEAQRVGVDPNFAFAIASLESDFDQFAESDEGAIGVMQLMPDTARGLGVVNSWDAMQNIRGGVSYIAELQAEFKSPILVAAAYHSGPQAVRDAQGIPPGPRVAAYTVRLLNEFYRIYQLSTDPLATAGAAEPATGLKPIAKPRRSAPARTAMVPAEGGQWEAGFVLNLD